MVSGQYYTPVLVNPNIYPHKQFDRKVLHQSWRLLQAARDKEPNEIIKEINNQAIVKHIK